MKPLCLMSLCLLVGCSTKFLEPEVEIDSKINLDSRAIISWEESMIRGFTFKSLSDDGIVWLGFPETGNRASVSIRTNSGFSLAPVWFWTLQSPDLLVLSNHSGDRRASFELIQFSMNEMTVRVNKKITRYERSKHQTQSNTRQGGVSSNAR